MTFLHWAPKIDLDVVGEDKDTCLKHIGPCCQMLSTAFEHQQPHTSDNHN